MQFFISNAEEADSSYAFARSVSVLDAVNLIGLAVKKIKAETVKKFFAKAGFGESDVADNLEEAMKTLLQYLISAEETIFRCYKGLCFDKNTKSGNEFLCWICGRNLSEFYIGNM
jgi:hypothetical protein